MATDCGNEMSGVMSAAEYAESLSSLHKAGRSSEAEVLLSQALALYPEDAELLARQCEHHMSAKRWSEAAALWPRVVAVRGDQALALDFARHSEALRNARLYDEADAVLVQAQRQFTEAKSLNALRRDFAEVAMARRDWNAAADRWQEALQHSEDPQARLGLSMAEAARGRAAEASDCLRKGLEFHPNDVSLLRALVDLAMQARNWEEVVEASARIAASPDVVRAATDYIAHAAALRNLRRYDDADLLLVSAFPRFSDVASLKVLKRSFAEVAMARPNWNQAVERWWAALAYVEDVYARTRLAKALSSQGKLAEASGVLQQGLEAFPGEIGLLRARADLALQAREWDVATMLSDQILSILDSKALAADFTRKAAALRSVRSFEDADSLLLLAFERFEDVQSLKILKRSFAEVASARSDWSEAARRWRAALAHAEDVYARARLARIVSAQGKLEEASEILKQGLKAHPNDAHLLKAFAELSFQRQDWKLTSEVSDRIIALSDAEATLGIYVRASLAKRHSGEFDDAERQLHVGIMRNPQEAEVWKFPEITPQEADILDEPVSLRRLASELLAPGQFVRAESQAFSGGLGNNGCFIHTFLDERGGRARVFEKWPMNIRVRGQKLQELRFYTNAYSTFDDRCRSLMPRPRLVARFGSEAVIITEYVDGEIHAGEAPKAAALESIAAGLATLATAPLDGLDIGAVGPILDQDIMELKRAVVPSAISAAMLETFHESIAQLNEVAYANARKVLCHNDINWSNLLFNREHGINETPRFIDWGRAAKHILGADLQYFTPGTVRNYSQEVFDQFSSSLTRALSHEGCNVSNDEIVVGAYYAAMQWSIERATLTRSENDVRRAFDMNARLRSICL